MLVLFSLCVFDLKEKPARPRLQHRSK